ncbi:helix-turn-helix transcriptional regulator [Bifidobacterium simiarum]|nr:helix-turn-helix transcriptional regulator [Bifidobacterium simiarum]
MDSPVRRWRRAKGITQHQLASEMGQSDANLSQKESGKITWQQSDLSFLKQRYGLSADFVLGFKDSSTTGEIPVISKEVCA